jgi:hypothetical protein
MNASFEQTLVDVWRQVLVQNASVVVLNRKRYSVRITPRKGLRQVDFVFDRNEIRGLEQNPEITLGTNGAVRQKGDAVFERGTVRGECRGWEGNFVRQMKREKSLSTNQNCM